MPSQKKVEAVTKIAENLKNNPNFTVVSFSKTTHKKLEELRRELYKVNARVTVIKNSLLTKALEQVSASNENVAKFITTAGAFKDSTAVMTIAGDWSEAVKAFFKFSEKEVSMVFRMGLLDGSTYSGQDLVKIAKLPGKLELLAKVIGSMKSPITRIDNSIKFPMTYFVNVLNARAKQA